MSTIYIPEKITGSVNKVRGRSNLMSLRCYAANWIWASSTRRMSNQCLSLSPRRTSYRGKYVAHAKNSFDVKRHVALMTKAISVEMHKVLQGVKSQQPLNLGSNTLGYQALQMFDVTINGAMFIGPVSEHDDDDYRCVVYLPDDPLHPLKEYASFSDFELELSRTIEGRRFPPTFFMRYIKLGERSAFLQALDKGLALPSGSPFPASSIFVRHFWRRHPG